MLVCYSKIKEMKRAGVYRIRGTRGTRVGQSKNVPRRIPQVLREHERCIGKPVKIDFFPAVGQANRRRLEKKVIARTRPSCNIINA